jgi:hypothetical protein
MGFTFAGNSLSELMNLPGECLVTMHTFVRIISCMIPLVSQYVSQLSERLVTFRTVIPSPLFMTFCMSS